MSELKKIRELRNLTQEEVAERSGLSVRTIQRIEAGVQPKGYTLKTLALSLDVPESDLRIPEIQFRKEIEVEEIPEMPEKEKSVNFTLVKLINLSSLPFAWFPVANVLPPLLIMLFTKEKSQIVRQIISLQIFLTIVSPVIFIITALFKPGHSAVLAVMVMLVLINMYVILRNAYEIDRKGKLYYKLNFSIL
ncbi:helix-turn-helix domain-containing protein [Chryseobacterium sp. SN22]|uniref:helix-turn-helix domain-containing protein n=1 Tax=Chryseobacterium sp. SN22 TaxID=2606431 RepID=UPI0011EE85CC|nr:helix-turn-helix domain-containing protein [Chryseobacterium sp. SN22]KAA0128906.1 helix-turn-helix domain-containing protein [Chryseobacterium sp. SN22]